MLLRWIILALAFQAFHVAASAAGQSGPMAPPPGIIYQAPCDILAANGMACVAAHSVTRRLFASYAGPVFQIKRASDSAVSSVGTVAATGVTNLATVASFCSGTTCKYSNICDQVTGQCSSGVNDLPQATTANQAAYATLTVPPINGTSLPVIVTSAGQFYRNRTNTSGIPTGSNRITLYMVVSNSASATCCGTYGDVEATIADTGSGHMFALAYSTGSAGVSGTGPGPWPGVDWENGVYLYGATPSQAFLSIFGRYNTTGPAWSLKSGDATQGTLTTLFSGALPAGYVAQFEGGLSLGEGGDGTPAPVAFFEGVVVADATSDAVDNLIQANIAAFYSTGH